MTTKKAKKIEPKLLAHTQNLFGSFGCCLASTPFKSMKKQYWNILTCWCGDVLVDSPIARAHRVERIIEHNTLRIQDARHATTHFPTNFFVFSCSFLVSDSITVGHYSHTLIPGYVNERRTAKHRKIQIYNSHFHLCSEWRLKVR